MEARTNLDSLLARYAVGDVVECIAFRRDELMRFDIRLATQPPLKYELTAMPGASRAAQKLKSGWLGT